MSKKIVLAGIFHETNTFLKNETSLAEFTKFTGEQLLAFKGDRASMSGFLEVAQHQDWEIIPTVLLRSRPSGMAADDVVEDFWKEFSERVGDRLSDEVDAVFLVLHGAMVSQSYDDVEGEILGRIRTLAKREIPVFGVLDLHVNYTPAMAEYSNCLYAYHENPHTDAFEAAAASTELLVSSFEAGIWPVTYQKHSRHLFAATLTGTADEPMKSLEACARRIEEAEESIWVVNVMAGFPNADMPETGLTFSIVAKEGSDEVVERTFDALLQTLGQVRKRPNEAYPVDVAIDEILKKGRFPAILVEPADNIGGGTPGDNTEILKALVASAIESAGVILADAEAVEILKEKEIGSVTNLSIGGKSGELGAEPMTLDLELVSISDGEFTLEDPHSHLASMAGLQIEMGPTVVVRHDGILIMLTTVATPPFDLGQWRSQGIDPATFQAINVKSAVAYRQAYQKISEDHYYIKTVGPCSDDLDTLPYAKLIRPIWPLDS
jgi:microcystin degradation protein MlrC